MDAAPEPAAEPEVEIAPIVPAVEEPPAGDGTPVLTILDERKPKKAKSKKSGKRAKAPKSKSKKREKDKKGKKSKKGKGGKKK